jgi:hypothetical protein
MWWMPSRSLYGSKRVKENEKQSAKSWLCHHRVLVDATQRSEQSRTHWVGLINFRYIRKATVWTDCFLKCWNRCIGLCESEKWRRSEFYLSLHRLLSKAATPSIEHRHTHIALWSTNFEIQSCTQKFIHIWYLFNAIWDRYVEDKKGMSDTRSHRSRARILLISVGQHGNFCIAILRHRPRAKAPASKYSRFWRSSKCACKGVEWTTRRQIYNFHLARFRCPQVKGSAKSYTWLLSTHFGDMMPAKISVLTWRCSPHVQVGS